MSADGVGAGAGNVMSLSSGQVYSVLMEAEVRVAVVVYPAAVRVVVYVSMMVRGSGLVAGAAFGVQGVLGS